VAAVAATRAPAVRQRATTPGSGWPKRLWAPAETSASRARVAATKAGSEDPRLPWWATTTASARNAPAPARTRPRSTTSPMSPGSNSVAPPAARTRSTQLDSLSRYGNQRVGCRNRNSTPSQRQCTPARQCTRSGAGRGAGAPAAGARRRAGMPSGDQVTRGGNACATDA